MRLKDFHEHTNQIELDINPRLIVRLSYVQFMSCGNWSETQIYVFNLHESLNVSDALIHYKNTKLGNKDIYFTGR